MMQSVSQNHSKKVRLNSLLSSDAPLAGTSRSLIVSLLSTVALFHLVILPAHAAQTGFVMPTTEAAEVGGWNNIAETDTLDGWINASAASVAGDEVSGSGSLGSFTASAPYRYDHSWGGFTFDGIGANDTIDGIEVMLGDAYVEGSAGVDQFQIELYTSAGSHNWSANYASGNQDQTITGTDLTFGGSTDKWSWTAPVGSAVTDGSFKVKVVGEVNAGGNSVVFDTLAVRVYYTADAGVDTDGFGVASLKTTAPDTFYVGGSLQSVKLYLNSTATGTAVETFTITVPPTLSWTGNSGHVALSDVTSAVDNAESTITGSGTSTDSWVIKVTNAFCTGAAGAAAADGCTVTISNLRFDGGKSYYNNQTGINGLTHRWLVQTARDTYAVYPIATQPTQTLAIGTGAVLIGAALVEGGGGANNEWVQLYNPESYTLSIASANIIDADGGGAEAALGASDTIAGYGFFLVADATYTSPADVLDAMTFTDGADAIGFQISGGPVTDSFAFGTGKAEGDPITATATNVSYYRLSLNAADSSQHLTTGGHGEDNDTNLGDFFLDNTPDSPNHSGSTVEPPNLDAKGSLTFTPTVKVAMGGRGEWTLTYTPSAVDTYVSGRIDVGVPSGWSNPQVTAATTPGWVTTSSNGTIGSTSVSGETLTINLTALTPQQTVTINYGYTNSGADSNALARIGSDSAPSFRLVGHLTSQTTGDLKNMPTQPDTFNVTTPGTDFDGDPDSEARTFIRGSYDFTLTVNDGSGNPVMGSYVKATITDSPVGAGESAVLAQVSGQTYSTIGVANERSGWTNSSGQFKVNLTMSDIDSRVEVDLDIDSGRRTTAHADSAKLPNPIISEILYDPLSTQTTTGEYVEIYNPSHDTIVLGDSQFHVTDSSSATLLDKISSVAGFAGRVMGPHSYLLLHDDAFTALVNEGGIGESQVAVLGNGLADGTETVAVYQDSFQLNQIVDLAGANLFDAYSADGYAIERVWSGRSAGQLSSWAQADSPVNLSGSINYGSPGKPNSKALYPSTVVSTGDTLLTRSDSIIDVTVTLTIAGGDTQPYQWVVMTSDTTTAANAGNDSRERYDSFTGFGTTTIQGSVTGIMYSTTSGTSWVSVKYPYGVKDSFQVLADFDTPGTTTLMSPAEGNETTTLTPRFSWLAVGDSHSGVDSYVLHISANSSFTSNDVYDTVDSGVTAYDITTSLDAKTYYWRVKPIDRAGIHGYWSDSRSFSVSPDVSGANFWYVNDGTYDGSDSYSQAVGALTNSGKTRGLPALQIDSVAFQVSAGDTIRIDAGTYAEYDTIAIDTGPVWLLGVDSSLTLIKFSDSTASSFRGLYIDSNAVTVRDLALTNGYFGAFVNGADTATFTRVRAEQNETGIIVKDKKWHTFSQVYVRRNDGNGIVLYNTDSSTIRQSRAFENGGQSGGAGFLLVAGSDTNELDTNVSDSNSQGFRLNDADSNYIRWSTTAGDTSVGFQIENGSGRNVLYGDTAITSADSGFAVLSADNQLYSNHAWSSVDAGFYLAGAHNSVLDNNWARFTTGAGFSLTRTNVSTLSRNRAYSGSDSGFVFAISQSNTVESNSAVSNTKGGFGFLNISHNNVVRSDSAVDNGGDGFFISDGGASGSDSNLLMNNLARNNRASGIKISGSKNNHIVENQLDSNLHYAFHINEACATDTFNKNNIVPSPWTIGETNGVYTSLASIDITRNFWNTTDSNKISNRVNGPNAATADYIPHRLNLVDTRPGKDTVAPSAPDTIAADSQAEATKITVKWARVTADEEGDNDTVGLSGYRIYRSQRPTTDTDWSHVGSVASDTDHFYNTGLTAETGYYYRVASYDTAETTNIGYFSGSIAYDSTAADTSPAPEWAISADSSNAGHFQGIATRTDSATVYTVVSTSTGALVSGTTVVLTSSKGSADTIYPSSCNSNSSGVCTFTVSTLSTTKSRLTVTMGGYKVMNETPTITWYDTTTGVNLGFGAGYPETSLAGVTSGAFVLWPVWRSDGRALAYISKTTTSEKWNVFTAFDDATNGDTAADDGQYMTRVATNDSHNVFHVSRPAWIDVLGSSGTRDSDGTADIVFSSKMAASRIHLLAVRADGSDNTKESSALVALTRTSENARFTMPVHPAGGQYIYAISTFEVARFPFAQDPVTLAYKIYGHGDVTHMSSVQLQFIHSQNSGEANTKWVAVDLAAADTSKIAVSFVNVLPNTNRYKRGAILLMTNAETAVEDVWQKANDTTVFLGYRGESNVAWNLSWDTTKSILTYCVDVTGNFSWQEFDKFDTRPDYAYASTDFDVMGLYVSSTHTTPNKPVSLIKNSGTSNDLSLTFSPGDTARVAYIAYDKDADTISLKIVEMDGRTTIDQSGGVLFEGGRLTAIIDEGDVLNGKVNISVQLPAATPTNSGSDSIALTGNAREFFPDGQQFSDSITIILYYDATDLSAAGIANGSDSENLLKIYWYDGSGWRDQGAIVNPEDRNGALGSLTFVTNHFSIYSVGYVVRAGTRAGDTYAAVWQAISRLGGDRAIAGETITITLEVKDSTGAAAKWPKAAKILIDGDTWTKETKVVSPSATSITTRFATAGEKTITVREGDSSYSFKLLVIEPPTPGETIVLVSGRKGIGQRIYHDDTSVTIILKSQLADTNGTRMMLLQLPGETIVDWTTPSSFDSPLMYWEKRPISGIEAGALGVVVARSGVVVKKDTVPVLGKTGAFRENPDTSVASIEVSIDTGAVDTPVTVSMNRSVSADTYASASGALGGLGRNVVEGSIIQLEAEDIDGNRIKKFNKKVKLKFPTSWRNGLRIAFLNNGVWEEVDGMVYDTVSEVATIEVDHLSVWGVTAGFNAGPGVESVRVYPNPWRSDGPTRGLATTNAAYGIKFDLLPAGNVNFRIFTITGQKILDGTLNPGTLAATAANGHLQVVDVGGTTGQVTRWDLMNQNGHEVASGLYLIVLEGPGGIATRKVAVIR